MGVANEVLAYLRVLIWPGVISGALYLFRGQVRTLLGRLSSFSTPWGSAKFGEEVAKLADRAQELEDKVVAPGKRALQSTFREPAVAEPTMAFLDAYRTLEAAARDAAGALGIRHGLPVPVARYLDNRSLAPSGVGEIAEHLRSIRNEVVHGSRRLQEEDAQNLIAAIDSLTDILTNSARSARNESPPPTDPFGN